ncbi:MAG: asparagine synthase (glutamine-hydrolyzing) [Verrucomicrobiales bacterium]|nr:asparagine synthase (glutamine-hydrolyzing) [Verrucomicrobiales bacterium]
MCGIAGFFSADEFEDQLSGDILEGMLETIHHRGPDGRGRHIDGKKGLALGHTRLSINDLAGGWQPLYSRDRKIVQTINGEFYDFKRYRSLLMADGERMVTKSDSEIALGLYKKHGLDFTKYLRGEFAFVLYDDEKDELILVRDRFGIRPLFFSVQGDTLVYGSEVKAVLAHPKVEPKLSSTGVLHQLMQTIVPGSSAFEGVHAIEPGHLLRVKRNGKSLSVEQHRYWDMDFPLEADRPEKVDPQEHIDRIRDELIRAIVFRLEADVDVGCYLSGGIDSCCILGLATGAMQSAVKAFTISFDNDDYDEASIAREMAESMGADQEMIHLKAEDLYGDNYVKTVWHAERSFYNTLGVAKYLMSKRVNECGYKTVITGEGSDELFAGYPALKRDMFQHGLSHESDEVKAELHAALEKSNKLFKGAILSEDHHTHSAWDAKCGFTPSWIQPWMATLELAKPLLAPELREELKDYDPIGAIAEKVDQSQMEGRHPLDIAQYTWSKCQLEGQILNWGGDRVDMANSMESRPAFLDHHLAAAAVDVPPSLRIKGNIEKWVLREAVKGVLPEVLYKREKFAFMAPPAHTDEKKKAKVEELIDEYLSESKVKNAGALDEKAVTSFVEGWRTDTDPVSLVRKDTLLNHLLCVQILHSQFC